MQQHEIYMQRCIALAEKGLGSVAPNPMVGAVLVHEGRIIGEGFHEKYGEAHAEVNCLQSVKAEDRNLIASSTLYVSLEPCSHYGKTPPCSLLILENNIPKIAIGAKDPFEEVNGKGIEQLRNAGREVIVGILEKECQWQNRRFNTFHLEHRPYIILKWAESEDGFIAPIGNMQYWLTNDFSKQLVHRWRTEEPAIMVGYNTVMADNPQLTARLWKGKNPVRVVVDQHCTLPKTQQIFSAEGELLLFNALHEEQVENVSYCKINFTQSIIPQVLQVLYKKGIQSVIIEGGQKILNLFIEANLWDEARVFKTQVQLLNGIEAPTLLLPPTQEENIDTDQLVTYYNLQHD
jgi:diaminohydroxyphosphoribosylaminopyrimidine deaminase/5-amino-6-(5-phosphoribosylamino)uracil reductase